MQEGAAERIDAGLRAAPAGEMPSFDGHPDLWEVTESALRRELG